MEILYAESERLLHDNQLRAPFSLSASQEVKVNTTKPW